MANEISVTGSISLSNTNIEITKSFSDLVTQTTERYHASVQTIGTTEEALTIGDISTIGYGIFHNADTTNFIELGLTGSYTVKLKAGEWAIFRLDSNAPYAKADTAACKLEYILLEE